MNIRPIIFSAPMVLALLAGRKTMTRRLLYSPRNTKSPSLLLGHHPDGKAFTYDVPIDWRDDGKFWTLTGWQDVKPGDLLYVRETWHAEVGFDDQKPRDLDRDECNILYVADDKWLVDPDAMTRAGKTRTAIHQPRWASRITLEITGTKIERLAAITDEDAIAEGIEKRTADIIVARFPAWFGNPAIASDTPRQAFASLWEMLHGKGSWSERPLWVVALTFKIHPHNVDSPAMKKIAEAA